MLELKHKKEIYVPGPMLCKMTADDEEPMCKRCDDLCCGLFCNKCGPEYGWAHYVRTIRAGDVEKDE